MTKIDTNDYKSLYGYHDIKRHGRFRELPDIHLKPEVKRKLKEIENGEEESKEFFNGSDYD